MLYVSSFSPRFPVTSIHGTCLGVLRLTRDRNQLSSAATATIRERFDRHPTGWGQNQRGVQQIAIYFPTLGLVYVLCAPIPLPRGRARDDWTPRTLKAVST